jgi:hypothetical protein
MTPPRQNRPVRALFSLSGIALCSVVLAQTPSAQRLEEKFKAADTNHDGKLTLEEAKVGMPRVANAFDRIDVEKKGYITLEQLQTFVAQHRWDLYVKVTYLDYQRNSLALSLSLAPLPVEIAELGTTASLIE